MKKEIIFVLAIILGVFLTGILLFLIFSKNPKNNIIEAKVIRVIDGDTFKVKLKDGNVITIRILGVDFPDPKDKIRVKILEKYGTSKDKILYCYNKGNNLIEKILTNKTIYLEYDPKEFKKDKYGRHLVYVWVDCNLISSSIKKDSLCLYEAYLIENGYARFYDPTKPMCTYCKKLKDIFYETVKSKRGCLWSK
jgi:endonuclease YncB( thermonuclease family)